MHFCLCCNPRYVELCRASSSSHTKYAFIISLVIEKASKNISVVQPTFSAGPLSNQEQLYYDICLKSCLKKHRLCSKLEKIVDIKTFELFAERWHQKQHEYNKVLNFVDWNNATHYAHKSCKGTFFKESFLNTQINIEYNETEETTEINQTENNNSNVETQLSRKSN